MEQRAAEEREKGEEEGQTEDRETDGQRTRLLDREEEEEREEWDRVEITETDCEEGRELPWEEEAWDPNRYVDVWAPDLCPACQEPLFAVCECVGVSLATEGRKRRAKWEEHKGRWNRVEVERCGRDARRRKTAR